MGASGVGYSHKEDVRVGSRDHSPFPSLSLSPPLPAFPFSIRLHKGEWMKRREGGEKRGGGELDGVKF